MATSSSAGELCVAASPTSHVVHLCARRAKQQGLARHCFAGVIVAITLSACDAGSDRPHEQSRIPQTRAPESGDVKGVREAEIVPNMGPPPTLDGPIDGGIPTLFQVVEQSPQDAPLIAELSQLESDAVSLFRDACTAGYTERSRPQFVHMWRWLETNHPALLTEADIACGRKALDAR